MINANFHRFRLYVAGSAVNSTQALDNLTAFCESHLAGRHTIEVVDVFLDPQRALADGIFMTPALVRLEPPPERMVVGNLSRTHKVLATLGLSDAAA